MQPPHDDLNALFPKLTPLSKPPVLFTLNGIGLRLYGKREEHVPTETYIKTQCICFLFVPLLALHAYRVRDATEGGWYFWGREPLSPFARRWNWLFGVGMVLLGLLGGGWRYTHSEGYRAQQQLAIADGFAKEGKWTLAVERYIAVGKGTTSHAKEALKATKKVLSQPHQNTPSRELFGILKTLTSLPQETRKKFPSPFGAALMWSKQLHQRAPKAGLELLELVRPLYPQQKRQAQLWLQRQKLLTSLATAHPKDLQIASQLAEAYEHTEKCRRCEAILTPFAGRLGTQEGARILGQIYTKRREFSKAEQNLMPYVSGRLKLLHKAESELEARSKEVRMDIIRRIQQGQGPTHFYAQSFRELPDDERNGQIIAYIRMKLRQNPQIEKLQRRLLNATRVVPVAMELGFIKLQRARRLRQPELRNKELRAAEQLFLAIRGIAGRSAQYQLYLGQIYYWLGNQEKGRGLFETLLEKSKRSPERLLQIANVLREVGDRSEARKLAEEAFQKGKQLSVQQEAAALRALTSLHVDAKILWLKRANLALPDIAALLYNAQGNRAWQRGDMQEAASQYRKAIESYEKLEKTATSLNNSALAYFSLFRVTGDHNAFRRGSQQLSEAIALRPGDSILIFNAASANLRAAILDIMRKRISLPSLKLPMHLGLLSYLYRNETQRAQVVQQLLQHPDLRKAQSLYERVIVLAPNNLQAYDSLSRLHHYTRNLQGLQEVAQQLKKARLVQEEEFGKMRAHYAGERDTQYQESFEKQIAQLKQIARQLRKAPNQRSFAVAANRLIYTELAAYMHGRVTDGKRLLQLARRAHAIAPSSHTQRALVAALLFQVSQQLSGRNKTLATLLQHARRALLPHLILVASAHQDKSLRKLLKRTPRFQQAFRLVRQQQQWFPQRREAFHWALLDLMAPKYAKLMAKQFKEDQLSLLFQELQHKLFPMRATIVIERYWRALATKQTQQAKALLQTAVHLGIPLPFPKPKTK